MSLYEQYVESLESAGLKPVCTDTAARILAVVCVHGNNEAITHNNKLTADLHHIMRSYHIEGGGIPDPKITKLFIRYIHELEYAKTLPPWVNILFNSRYAISIYANN